MIDREIGWNPGVEPCLAVSQTAVLTATLGTTLKLVMAARFERAERKVRGAHHGFSARAADALDLSATPSSESIASFKP